VALDDRYANKFAPRGSTAIYAKPGHTLLYTSLTSEMKCLTSHTFALRILFELLQCWCHTSTNLHQAIYNHHKSCMAWSHMNDIWSTSCLHVTLLVHRSQHRLSFTIALVHWRQVIAQCKLLRHMRSVAPKPLTCPSHLQPVHRCQAMYWSSPLSHITPYHVSYAWSPPLTTSWALQRIQAISTSMAQVAHTSVHVD